uniref:NADHK n=1 Tax=Arundo donax TaxID=35708 RepID=A0A0A9G5L7_ARUDO
MAAVDPAAVETLRPLDLQLIKCKLSPLLFLFLKEKRETLAGHGCDTNISFRAYVGS